jgi:hypothetical protein
MRFFFKQELTAKTERLALMVAIFIMMLVLYLLLPQKGMSPVWSVPYFSGAKEWALTGGWLFQPLEVDAYKQLYGWEIYRYQFDQFSKETLIKYAHNSSGYLYLVMLSQLLFPFLGPVGSIVLLQGIAHVLIFSFIYRQMDSRSARCWFLFLYLANPLVLYFVVYPFYYFWQALPSFVLLFYYFKIRSGGRTTWMMDFFLALLLLVGLSVRNTTILMAFATVLILVIHAWRRAALVHILVLLIGGWFWIQDFEKVESYGPWHNAFIGFAGYPNQIAGLEIMNDDTGYAWYNKYSGRSVDASIEGNFTTDIHVAKHYYTYMKESFLKMVQMHPIQFLRNVCLNFFQGFSVGYLSKTSFIGHLLAALSGFLVAGFFVWKKAWIPLIVIAASHITYSLYYPPIPAYLYGTYLLTICFLLDVYFRTDNRSEGIA